MPKQKKKSGNLLNARLEFELAYFESAVQHLTTTPRRLEIKIIFAL